MSIINRFFLLCLSLAGIGGSAAVLGVSLQLISEQVLLEQAWAVLGQQGVLAAAVLCLLISLNLLAVAFHRSGKPVSKGEYVICSGPQGEVRVALEAIRNLVDRLARETHGVHDAKVQVAVKTGKEADMLSLRLRLVVGRDVDVTKLSENLTATIQQKLAQIMALLDVPVNIVVTDVTDEMPAPKHRVV